MGPTEMISQTQIDKAYAEGKAAHLKDLGTYLPTLRQIKRRYTPNPYPHDNPQLRLSWERGYRQDVRRVVGSHEQ